MLSLFLISVFTSINFVQADILTNELLINPNGEFNAGFDTNIGTTVSLNGMDVFCTDRYIIFCSGSSANMLYNYSVPAMQYNYEYRTRIIQFNSTCVLAVTMAGYKYSTTSGIGIEAVLINTYNNVFTTVTYGTINNQIVATLSTPTDSYLVSSLTLFTMNDFYYCYFNMIGTRSGVGKDVCYSLLIKINGSGAHTIVIDSSDTTLQTDITESNYTSRNMTKMIAGASNWIVSQTTFNTVYIIGASQGEYRSVRVIKIDVVAPSVTFIGDYSCYYPHSYFSTSWIYLGGSSWFVDYDYANGKYTVLFVHSYSQVGNPTDTIATEVMKFNDTYLYVHTATAMDSESFGNIVRPMDVIPPNLIWGNPSNPTLFDSGTTTFNFTYLYAGTLAYIMQQQVTITDLNTDNPSFDYPIASQKFRDGGANILTYSASNDVSGCLSPYGYGNLLEMDIQNRKVRGDFQITTNPSTGLLLEFDTQPNYLQKTVILPQTSGGSTLSQNITYYVTMYLLIKGIPQTSGTYTVFSNTESQIDTWSRAYTEEIKVGAIQNNGQMSFTLSLESLMNPTAYYEAHQINVTTSEATYTFALGTTWLFEDSQGNTLPDTYYNKQTGNPPDTSGNNTGTNVIIPVTLWIVIIIYLVVTLMLTLLAGKSGLLAGLLLSTIFCMLAGLIPIWVILPIILVCVVILFVFRDNGVVS